MNIKKLPVAAALHVARLDVVVGDEDRAFVAERVLDQRFGVRLEKCE